MRYVRSDKMIWLCLLLSVCSHKRSLWVSASAHPQHRSADGRQHAWWEGTVSYRTSLSQMYGRMIVGLLIRSCVCVCVWSGLLWCWRFWVDTQIVCIFCWVKEPVWRPEINAAGRPSTAGSVTHTDTCLHLQFHFVYLSFSKWDLSVL